MMNIKSELQKLNDNDIYALIMFALYRLIDSPEYSTVSELSYILDRHNLLRLCEYFGGTTIRIPTITELEQLMYALLVYQYVNIDNMCLETALCKVREKAPHVKDLKRSYSTICEVLNNYSFDLNKYHVKTTKEDQ